MKAAAFLTLAATIRSAMAQNCIRLEGSTTCPAFNQSSISTDASVSRLFPFLSFVSDVQSFDDGLRRYISTAFSALRYEQQIGCSSLNLTDTTDIYARYTTSVLCNAIIQNSVESCSISQDQTRPLCADTCVQYAMSEQRIVSTPELCGTSGDNAMTQLRADFIECALPANSITTGECVRGVENEPFDCGYQSNLGGLCSFCASSSPNSTDSCCVNSQVESRCQNVHLPVTTPMAPLFPNATSSAVPADTAAADPSSDDGLSGGAIAGIVIGSILGALLILGLVIFLCILARRRRQSQAGSIFNQPSPARRSPTYAPQMTFTDGANRQPEMVPGGRVARMTALESSSVSSAASPRNGGVLGYRHSESDRFDDSPESQHTGTLKSGAPKRTGSLSSGSALALGEDPSSPLSGSGRDQFSSPEGVHSGQSEQLQSFKDYYSQDEIHPNNVVATLWAYQPRANDEWELERGDMLKVVGIWDDGWATGTKIRDRAEHWGEEAHDGQRDSGMSNGSKRPGSSQVEVDGEIKAFPLVCVCLPQHWRKTIEGELAAQPMP
ncbi:hypothetical protein M501DRAFT_927866 [Patellaria atrata CBS 101060]|uniref:SH3 domain-containing protein n=1 Tax=Patellaria atrata CBS 101060 TaxID=1346257 RepID=A0A9P4SG74_9PEZI|nr:hypothetical protein M501DRAFT_927866 [Patellaria atrata CBS 101060]